MLAYVGRSNDEIAELHKALKATVRAEVDGRGRKYEGRCVDGWGYVLVADSGIAYYKTAKPIIDDDHEIPRMDGKIYAMIHARKASDATLVESRFSHPFIGNVDDATLFLCHNGLIRTDQKNLRMTDTEYGLTIIEKAGVEKGVEMLKDITGTGLNLFILQMNKITGKVSLKYLNYYIDRGKNEYFDLFFSTLEDGKAIVSSSLQDHGIKGTLVEYGKLLDIENLE